ncbi:esterase/lipase family protein [Actinomadura macrotermitis]|nr:hypothetical protein [Actinomadura macrotermitis]
MTEQTVQPWSILGTDPAPAQAAPDPDAYWEFDGGFALVYYANSKFGLNRPVIFADGFNAGRSKPDAMWAHMETEGDYALVSALRESGRDVVMLGYEERSARIQDNAEVAAQCIMRAAQERRGDTPLAVGGFSMGGLVTRYALCKLETTRMNHQTGVYFSWDSPHRAAWIPISLQALAHYLKDEDGITEMSDHVNSPAACQLLWRHIETVDAVPTQHQQRTDFLRDLDRFGTWPTIPVKLGLANGSGTGTGLDVPVGSEMLKVTGGLHPYRTTTLYAQRSGAQELVARLKRQRIVNPQPAVEKRTDGLPELDAAPGGTLRSFGIARDQLAAGGAVECDHEWVDFVPSVSAVAIRDLDEQEDVYADIGSLDPASSDLDEFVCSSTNEEHSRITAELGEWLLDRLPK